MEAANPQKAIDDVVTNCVVPVKGLIVKNSDKYFVASEELEVEPVVVQEIGASGVKTVWREGDDE